MVWEDIGLRAGNAGDFTLSGDKGLYTSRNLTVGLWNALRTPQLPLVVGERGTSKGEEFLGAVLCWQVHLADFEAAIHQARGGEHTILNTPASFARATGTTKIIAHGIWKENKRGVLTSGQADALHRNNYPGGVVEGPMLHFRRRANKASLLQLVKSVLPMHSPPQRRRKRTPPRRDKQQSPAQVEWTEELFEPYRPEVYVRGSACLHQCFVQSQEVMDVLNNQAHCKFALYLPCSHFPFVDPSTTPLTEELLRTLVDGGMQCVH
jgi:hypothetical protein